MYIVILLGKQKKSWNNISHFANIIKVDYFNKYFANIIKVNYSKPRQHVATTHKYYAPIPSVSSLKPKKWNEWNEYWIGFFIHGCSLVTCEMIKL